MHSFFNKSRSLKNKLSPNPSASDRIPAAPDELGRPASSARLSATNSNPDTQPEAELQLLYGYIGLHTEIELDLPATARAVNLVAQELKAGALETPLLFSTHALDISTEGTHSLIRRFVHDQHDFAHDLTMHSPHNQAAFLKWLLSRHVNARGGHGIVPWEQYASWRESEKAFGYPTRFLSTHLLAQMSAPAASLLSCLLDLFASASIRADLTGMTVHKCGTLFGAYIFGLEDDKPFEQTYTHWLRQSHATEHLILAHMRDLKTQSPTGKLPLRMETTIQGYPSIIPSLIKTHPSARLERVARFQRLTPSYSKNLISSAGTWNVARSKTWDRLKPYPEIGAALYLNHSKAGLSTDPSKLLFAPSYKHLLNIKGQINLDNEEDDYIGANFEGPQRFKTLVQKEWSGFMNRGFQEPDAKKLQFNLDESSNAKLKAKRDTMDWDSFTGAGFLGRETYQPTDLDFNANIQTTAPPSITPPTSKKGITKKLIKASRSPSVFSYDTTPIELPSLFVDENFFEAWADVLVSSGWCRDELKEVSWALIYCKCKPADHPEFEFRPTALNPDGRNDDMWALFEEVIPAEYQAAQLNSQKPTNNKHNRRSFLRVITRKESKRSPNGSTHEKAASTPASSLHYYPNAPQSHATSMSNSNSQSSFTYQVTPSDSFPSPAVSTASQPGHVGLFRSLSKMIQGGHSPVNVANIRHPAHVHAMNHGTESVDELSSAASSESWANPPGDQSPAQSTHRPVLRSVSSSETTRGISNSSRIHRSSSEKFDRPPNPTPPPSDRPGSCSTTFTLDGPSHTEHEGLVHDGSRSSAFSRSIASSSDFTVELAERLPEGASSHLLPPSLIPIKSINPRKISPTDPIRSSNLLYNPSNVVISPRHGERQLAPQSTAYSGLSLPLADESNHPTSPLQQLSPERQTVPQDWRQRLEQLRLEQQQKREEQHQQPKEQEPYDKAQQYSPPSTHYQRTQHPLQEQQQHQQPLQRQKELQTARGQVSPVSPQFLKSGLRKVELNASVSSLGSFDPPAGGNDEDWHLSLRKSVSPLGPVANNYYSSRPVLPPQFDIKAKKVSNIVDLFEKAQPESPPRENDSRTMTYALSASPIRIPVRSLKLSRVGEQEEK